MAPRKSLIINGRKNDDRAVGGFSAGLLGAYQYLLDWHLDWYQSHKPQASSSKLPAPIHRDAKGNWRLTTAERKRILLNNIYGVDIDEPA